MTPTEIEKINREFAERLFTVRKVENCFNMYYEGYECVCDGTKVIARLKDWDPYHRWDHAAMGLEKFPMWTVRKDKKLYQAMVRPWSSYTFYSEWVDTALAAICIACIKAKKEE